MTEEQGADGLPPITRRDFLDGVAIGIGGALGLPDLLGAFQGRSPYPPALTGLRGAHPGAFEAFHALRDGAFWRTAPAPRSTGESYDLVVVGAGLSGLAAADHYRRARPGARILLLDNHDDFGGHAKRNEFTAAGRLYLGYGGTQSIDSPAPYSADARRLVAELGVDVARYGQMVDDRLYPSLGLEPAFFFDREAFGVDRLVRGEPTEPAFRAAAPLSARARRDLARLATARFDPLPALAGPAKRLRLARTSYRTFLLELWRVDPSLLPLFETSCHDLFGVGIDAVAAQDAFGLGLPGFQGMGLDPAPGPGQNYDAIRSPEAATYYCHFPDGNATLARLLVRRLVPEAVSGRSADDVVTARVDYRRLDHPGAGVRIRLSSVVLRVRLTGSAGSARPVEVTYQQGGRLETVTARATILACWHSVIPYLCPDLPAAQKTALAYETKVPLVYTNVLVRDWTAFQRLGVREITCPSLWHTSVSLDFPVSVGTYRCPRSPTEPIVLHLFKGDDQAGSSRARPASGRPDGASGHQLRDHRAADSGRPRSAARAGRLSVGARRPRDHRQPLAPRLRLPVQLAVRRLLAGR